MWSEAACGVRQHVERGSVWSEAACGGGSVWSETACGVRQCVE